MRKEQLSLFNKYLDLFEFKTFVDAQGNEFVLYKSDDINQLYGTVIEDKTAFEAVQNHVHIFDNIKQGDREQVIACMKKLGELMISVLGSKFVQKHFVVFVTVGDGAIIRFHQKWDGEPWYYMTDCKYESSELFWFDN